MVLPCLLTKPSAAAEDWPGWRGDGTGVSVSENLPVEWGPDQNVIWKVEIPGDGISQPIIWGDRVYVTTAVESTGVSRWRNAVTLVQGGLLLVLVGILATALSRRRRDTVAPSKSKVLSVTEGLQLAAAVIGTGGFFLGAAVLLFQPERVIPEGDPARAWLVSGVVALAGAVAGVAWLVPRSRLQVLGAVLLAACAALFYVLAPLNLFTKPIEPWKRAVVSAPLAGAAVWFIALALLVRARPNQSFKRGRAWRRSGAGSIVVTAVTCLFVFVNFIKPAAGIDRSVLCLDKATGRTLWQAAAFQTIAERKYRMNSYATPTPVTDGESIVAAFGPGIACLDLDGLVKWTEYEPNFFEYLRYGAGASPVLHAGKTIYTFMAEWPGGSVSAQDMNYEYRQHSYMRAVSTETGDEVWRIQPDGANDSYSTPLLATVAGREVLVFPSFLNATGIDPATGETLWKRKSEVGQPVPGALYDERTVYLTGGTHGPRSAVALAFDKPDGSWTPEVRWSITKRVPTCSSPVLYKGLLYWVTEQGIAQCIDAESGDVLWRERLGGHHVGALVAGDGKVYITADNGVTTVLRAGPTFEKLATNTIGEPCGSSLAIADGRIFVRGHYHLFCVGR